MSRPFTFLAFLVTARPEMLGAAGQPQGIGSAMAAQNAAADPTALRLANSGHIVRRTGADEREVDRTTPGRHAHRSDCAGNPNPDPATLTT
jgi:hypothetical protein